MPAPKSFLPLLVALPHASAWGNLGHTTVAYIAQDFVSDKTAQFAKTLLGDTSSNYLASVATWADTYRETKAGHFSAPFHFIDSLDTPPKSCNVNYERDCPNGGCIVSAIANYSSRAVEKNIGLTEQQKAFKWVVHFVGDIHQPLHVENLDVGGNKISVTFDGDQTNLHSVWDTAIPQKAAGSFSLPNARAWATALTADIRNGKYASESSTWLQGLKVDDAIDSAMVWASDSNKYVCTAVIPNGVDAVTSQDLSGSYYDGVIPVVEEQIAKAGYRLAAWLDAIVAAGGKSGTSDLTSAKLMKKSNYKLEPWMVAARQARRDFGDDCGCAPGAHEH